MFFSEAMYDLVEKATLWRGGQWLSRMRVKTGNFGKGMKQLKPLKKMFCYSTFLHLQKKKKNQNNLPFSKHKNWGRNVSKFSSLHPCTFSINNTYKLVVITLWKPISWGIQIHVLEGHTKSYISRGTFWSSPMVLTSFYKQILNLPAMVEREQQIWLQLIKGEKREAIGVSCSPKFAILIISTGSHYDFLFLPKTLASIKLTKLLAPVLSLNKSRKKPLLSFLIQRVTSG